MYVYRYYVRIRVSLVSICIRANAVVQGMRMYCIYINFCVTYVYIVNLYELLFINSVEIQAKVEDMLRSIEMMNPGQNALPKHSTYLCIVYVNTGESWRQAGVH